MTCKDCKGTHTYQPLIGPSEPCRACSDTGINRDVLFPVELKTASLPTLHRNMYRMRTALQLVRESLKADMLSGWTIEQKKKWMNLNADLNILTHMVKRMSDRTEEL